MIYYAFCTEVVKLHLPSHAAKLLHVPEVGRKHRAAAAVQALRELNDTAVFGHPGLHKLLALPDKAKL